MSLYCFNIPKSCFLREQRLDVKIQPVIVELCCVYFLIILIFPVKKQISHVENIMLTSKILRCKSSCWELPRKFSAERIF